MEDNLILLEIQQPGIIKLTLNRPEKRNALNIPLLKSLVNSLEKLMDDSKIRVIILCGNGPIFCAGLDLKEAIQPVQESESSHLLARTLQLLYDMPQVTLANIQGAALAGGAGLACACDFLIMDQNAVIGFPEVRRGLVAAQVMLFLKRQLNERQLKSLVLTGESISAQKAYEIGLATQIVEAEQLMPAALKISHQVLKGSPQAIHETKRLITSLSPRTFSEELEVAMSFHHAARRSSDAQEGTRAFFEKRTPSWAIH